MSTLIAVKIPSLQNFTATEAPPAKLGRHVIDLRSTGGDVSADGGSLLRQVKRRLALSKQAATALPEPPTRACVQMTPEDLLRQRVCGYARATKFQTSTTSWVMIWRCKGGL